ncbi:MAG: futalosine hydrolase [Bacteroidales bacterium]
MILLLAATNTEVSPFLKGEIPEGLIKPLEGFDNVEILITGVGVAATAFHLTKILSQKTYSHVINIGIAGTFNPQLSVGDVVSIGNDTFADYGVDDNGVFKTLFQLGLANPNKSPFTNGWMNCNFNINHLLNEIPVVKAVTVSMASGSQERINQITSMFNPDIETMESAGVFFTCLMYGVPFIGIRGISNRIEPRNRKEWNIQLATENCCSVAKTVLNKLSQ